MLAAPRGEAYPPAMRLPVLVSALLGAAGLAGVAFGCGDPLASYPPIQGCDNDAGTCSFGAGAGPGPDAGTTSTGTGGAQGTSELTGTVERISDTSFTTVSPASLTSAANIVLQPASGAQITVPYGGTAGTTFDLMNVAAGGAWALVQDESGGAAGIWSTISAVSVPQLAPIILPVVDQGIFTTALSNSPTIATQGIAATASHVVLVLQHQGAPYKGVQVTGGAGGAVVVYDNGPSVYSDTFTATGSAGMVILVNSALSGLTTVTLTDPTLMKSYTVALYTATGAVTLAGFDLE